MAFDYNVNKVRCDTCGKFMKWMEEGSSWCFVPDSDISYEEQKEQCKRCTEKYGHILPYWRCREKI